MRRIVWIWNHYATNMYYDKSGRHFWFAKNLIKSGYNPVIFCASTNHFSSACIDIKEGKYIVKTVEDIPFVFVRVPSYIGNGKNRVINMLAFYRNLFPVARKFSKENGKPHVILASSVHPLTLVAGIKISRKLCIPCICEVRDLWPESIVAYGVLERNSIITRMLYQGEKWIYNNADSIIMTWEGGSDYIVDRGWNKTIDIRKIRHISNGVSISEFEKNSVENQIYDEDLDDQNYQNIVYAGSVRKVNNLGMLLEAAKLIQSQGFSYIRFLIFGSGDELSLLQNKCKIDGITNVVFKGRVEKKFIPHILKKAHVNILHNSSTSLDKYGQSQNKLFEYLAAGRPIIQTYMSSYNIITKANCGTVVSCQNPENIANAIITICKDAKRHYTMGENARRVSKKFDFSILTEELIDIFENVTQKN